MRLLLRVLLPVLILAGFGWKASDFVKNKTEPRKFTPPPEMTRVEGKTLETTNYQIFLKTRGTVRPRTSTTLHPEVSGRIVSISPHFREGGFFEKEEILLEIEKLDYESAFIVATSQLAQARRVLEEEKARGEQAAENWRRLGKGGQPSEMVLRVPQREEAEARIKAAEADVERARRNLERTEIRAPYAGRIVEQRVDVGQYVTPNTQLGRAFATDVMEVHLPLTNQQLGFVDLPETFRDDQRQRKGPEVIITASIGRTRNTWKGEVVRVDSAIDEASRQLFVVAQIDDPYRRSKADGAPLKIGMYVDALVKGQELQNVIVLPRSTVRVSGEVLLIDNESRIQRRKVHPVWKGEREVVLPAEGGGIRPGEIICLTPMAYPVNGTQVIASIDGQPPKAEDIPGIKMKGKGGDKGERRKGKEKATHDRFFLQNGVAANLLMAAIVIAGVSVLAMRKIPLEFSPNPKSEPWWFPCRIGGPIPRRSRNPSLCGSRKLLPISKESKRLSPPPLPVRGR